MNFSVVFSRIDVLPHVNSESKTRHRVLPVVFLTLPDLIELNEILSMFKNTPEGAFMVQTVLVRHPGYGVHGSRKVRRVSAQTRQLGRPANVKFSSKLESGNHIAFQFE